MSPVEKYWLSVSPVTDSEHRTACAYIRDKWPDETISRNRAQELNMPIYKLVKPCKHGHKSWRYVNGQVCIACMRANPTGQLARHRRPKVRNIDKTTRGLIAGAPNLVISAGEAREAGLTAYRLGEPCGLCGKSTWRHIDTLACVECNPVNATMPPGQDMAFEESFARLRNTITSMGDDELKALELDIKKRIKKEPRHKLDLQRALRFVRRHIRERKQ